MRGTSVVSTSSTSGPLRGDPESPAPRVGERTKPAPAGAISEVYDNLMSTTPSGRRNLNLQIIDVHLDLGAGRRGVDMGPSAMHVAGLLHEVERLGYSVAENLALHAPRPETVPQGSARARYLPYVQALCIDLADRVEAGASAGYFPVTLGGDHSLAVGTISGLARHHRESDRSIGVIWVDAHADMNTPDSSRSGNLHGMPLAALLGYGPAELVSIAGPVAAVDPQHVSLIGVRDLDGPEKALVRETGVRAYTMSEIDERGVAPCVLEATRRATDDTDGVYLSLDLDAIDPLYAPGVGTPVAGGLSVREAHVVCEKVAESGGLLGVEIVELNPAIDVGNQTGLLAVWLLSSALGRSII